MFTKYVTKKIIRLRNSSKVLKLFYYYHKFFHEKGIGNIGFDFKKKKSRLFIVQDIIDKKKYQKYLEIGCFDDELFNHIKCIKKIGVDPVSGGNISTSSSSGYPSASSFGFEETSSYTGSASNNSSGPPITIESWLTGGLGIDGPYEGGSGYPSPNWVNLHTNAGEQPHNNMQPYLILNYIIKVE